MTADPRREPPSPSESRYVSVSRLRVPAERAPELLAAFARRARLVDGFDGFLGLEVWHSEREPGEILMVSRWRDRDAFTRYMRSDAHRRSHERIDPALQAVIKLERLEHLRGYDIVAR
jgi:heme-degrading monooxygenase HmoA